MLNEYENVFQDTNDSQEGQKILDWGITPKLQQKLHQQNTRNAIINSYGFHYSSIGLVKFDCQITKHLLHMFLNFDCRLFHVHVPV